MKYDRMSLKELEKTERMLSDRYSGCLGKGYRLDISRGKPGQKQLNMLDGMLDCISGAEDCRSEAGIDCRNYGLLDGIPEAKKLFSDLLGIDENMIMVCGNSSLNLMYDSVVRAMLYGVAGGKGPWVKNEKNKFLCPVPGYDRHFNICESLGIEMINVPMTSTGPDMDIAEMYAERDPDVRGIWCCPMYSNPGGETYSDETVERFAKMKPASPDFRIFWDNAYAVHHLYDDGDSLSDIFAACKKYGAENRVFYFASTSKITFPGSGVAVMAASPENLEQIESIMKIQTIGYDKINQIRHVKYFGNAENIRKHMRRLAAVLRPKFEIARRVLSEEIGDSGAATWNDPKGGYFISLYTAENCAKRTLELAENCGIKVSTPGAAFPYHHDAKDSHIRVAPTYPPDDELESATRVLGVCAKLAYAEKLLREKRKTG